jgi:4-amino-4-deoxy-L-arabinose transferase-like glycosyltransferase
MRKVAQWAAIALGFCWLAFVYASFYLVQQQRPVDGSHLRGTASTVLDLAVAGLLAFVCAGFGHRICRWIGVRHNKPLETIVWSGGVGLGAFALLVLGMGLLGWVTRWAMAIALLAIAIVSLPSLGAVGRAIGALWAMKGPPHGLRTYAFVMVLLTLLVALAPPLGWDGLFYHLTVPKLYLEQGRIAPVTDMPHQHFPGLMEMLYLAALSLKGDAAAKLLHMVYLGLLGGAIYLIAERHLGRGDGWPAVAAYGAIPMVFILAGWAYNDLALAFYQVVALYALLNWFDDQRRHWLILSAAACGLAMGLKYTSFVCPMVVVALICWHQARARAPWSQWLRHLSAFCLVTLTVAAPWYARNLAFTGNPVYPFAYGVFGGEGWDEWRAAWYARAGTGLGWDVGELAILPWTLTLGIRDMNFYDGRSGPLFLLALPFLIAWAMRLVGRSRVRPAAMGHLGLFGLAQYGAWLIGVVHSRSLFQSRLLLPAFAVLCPMVAHVYGDLGELDTRALSLRRVVGMSVGLVLIANLFYQGIYVMRIRPLPVLVGEESREAFLGRSLGAHYAAMDLINERVPADGRVLFLWEPRSYYCQRAVQPDAILERWAWLRSRYGDDLEGTALFLEQEGYTHVLLYRGGLELVVGAQLDPLDEADIHALDAFVQDHCEPVAQAGDAYVLYRLVTSKGSSR